jgi:hypothetical protein
MGRQAWAQFGPADNLLCPVLLPESSRAFPLLHMCRCRQFLLRLDEAPCPARFNTSSIWVLRVFHLLRFSPKASWSHVYFIA